MSALIADDRVKQMSERVQRGEQIKLNSMQHRRKIWFRFYQKRFCSCSHCINTVVHLLCKTIAWVSSCIACIALFSFCSRLWFGFASHFSSTKPSSSKLHPNEKLIRTLQFECGACKVVLQFTKSMPDIQHPLQTYQAKYAAIAQGQLRVAATLVFRLFAPCFNTVSFSYQIFFPLRSRRNARKLQQFFSIPIALLMPLPFILSSRKMLLASECRLSHM